MIRWLMAALALLLGADGPARASEPTGTARVTVRLVPDGIRATFLLDRAVERFAFARGSAREGEFELLTPGLAFAGDAVTGPRPFRRFEFRVRPMSRERDAQYPAHFRVGSGGVVHAPALKGDPQAWRTLIDFRKPRGQTVLPRPQGELDGFFYIGPAALVKEREELVLVADPDAPQWLVGEARTALGTAIDVFTGALGAPLPRKPVLIVTHQDAERSSYVGDVTPGPVTALRFHGSAWLQPDPKAGRQIQTFVLHEAFHFWNGGFARDAADAPAWLHEGGAEYAALVAARRAGLLDEAEARARLADALRRCRFGLQGQGDKPLSQLSFFSNAIRYPCGMVLQWAADLQVRAASGGRRTVLDAWADMLRLARARPEPAYGLADFRTAVTGSGEAFPRPFELLVDRAGPDRWGGLAAAFNALGAEVRLEPSVERRRGTLLFHLLRQNCQALPSGASIGFWTNEKGIQLQSPQGCGAISGDPMLSQVEGGDPVEMSLVTYEAAARRCAAGEPVRLTLADGKIVEARCAEALPPAPEDFAVGRALAER